jgi:hypothetical protein
MLLPAEWFQAGDPVQIERTATVEVGSGLLQGPPAGGGSWFEGPAYGVGDFIRERRHRGKEHWAAACRLHPV